MDQVHSVQRTPRNGSLFSFGDYLVFLFTLFTFMAIGMYYAWRGMSSSTSNYLFGKKQLTVFPIAMSLAASAIPASSLLSIPLDVYLHGPIYLWIIVAICLATSVSAFVFLPIYHRLKLVSVNEYLEVRFNRVVRRLIGLLYVVKVFFYLAFMVYGPSLALQRVSGINTHVSISIMFSVCMFYTAIGGFKAVVWTSTVQLFLMLSAVVVVFIKGMVDVGGLDVVYHRNFNSSRFEFFDIDLDPTNRHTVWSLSFGGLFLYISMYATDQVFIQRYLAVPSLKQSKMSLWLNLIPVGAFITCSCFTGLVAYAYYFDCSRLTAKKIGKTDDIVPFFVMKTFGNYPGLLGLFVAGVFSGAFCEISSRLNSVALVFLADFVKPSFPFLQDSATTLVAKVSTIVFGCFTFGMVFVVSKLGISLDAFLGFYGIASGVILGVFSLGIFVPWANSAGAGLGAVVSFALMMWLGVKAHNLSTVRHFGVEEQVEFLNRKNCFSNSTAASLPDADFLKEHKDDTFFLLRISYLWYSMMALVVVLFIGIAVSLLCGLQISRQWDSQETNFLSRAFRSHRPVNATESTSNIGEVITEM